MKWGIGFSHTFLIANKLFLCYARDMYNVILFALQCCSSFMLLGVDTARSLLQSWMKLLYHLKKILK